jgi:ABC-type antimicrobial peptide transport system permease subunit
MAIAVFILALAGINFVNLSTAQSIRRAREVGVRKVLGSGRTGLALQFLTETLLVVLFSVILAVSLVKPILGIFRGVIPPGVDFRVNGSVGLFLLVLTLLTTLLAGYYPARVLSSYRPVTSLKGAVEYQGNQGWTLRRGLIVFQFSISLAFIICTLVVGSQVRYMLRTDYGFKTDAIVTVATNPRDSARLIKVLQDRLSELPGIEKITRENGAPIGWGHMTMPFVYKGLGTAPVSVSEVSAGDESYVPFYNMHILAGRNIRHTDSLQEVLVNETATRSFGFKRPEQALGKFLFHPVNGKEMPFPIVGVVADYHTESFQAPIHSLVIGHLPETERFLGVRLAMAGKRTSDMQKSLTEIEKVYKSVYPNRDFDYLIMDESIRGMYEDEMSLSMLVRSAMLVTIFISCMGLFGVSLFAAQKRTREIGIRKVLGASVGNIVILLNREFLALVTLSTLIASPIAWWTMSRWLDGYAYRIRLGLPLFVVAGLCGILIALATVSFQSIRAARANPVKSLKTE